MTATKKIMIVEDEQFTLKMYTHLLKENGFDVVATPNTKEAARLVKANKPDMLIVDMMLQDGDGFDVIREVRKLPAFKKTPILVLSNLGQEMDISEAKKVGADKYLVKSNVRFEEVIKTVKELLKIK